MDRRIPEPKFPDDEGSASPQLRAALADQRHSRVAALAWLVRARLLVPVVAVLESTQISQSVGPGADGGRALAEEKDSAMAAVLLTGRDGRTALLAFTGTDSMAAWDSQARPVAVTAEEAALAALQQHADALVIDLAGPTMFVVDGADLQAFASGLRPVVDASMADGASPVRAAPGEGAAMGDSGPNYLWLGTAPQTGPVNFSPGP